MALLGDVDPSQVSTAAQLHVFSYPTMQMVSAQIDLESIRRREKANGDKAAAEEPIALSQPVVSSQPVASSQPPRVVAPVAPPTIALTLAKDDKPVLDFFGRPVAAKVQSNTGRTDSAALRQRQADKTQMRVWYKFHEGVSNAVRKRLLMRDLL